MNLNYVVWLTMNLRIRCSNLRIRVQREGKTLVPECYDFRFEPGSDSSESGSTQVDPNPLAIVPVSLEPLDGDSRAPEARGMAERVLSAI
ncbi:hypothetical protein OPV22_029179 [Ensete ventricosum]|uniref:Uncharacterized protein n=1 Tax=Ensete ventricosum TaxID=4639 RepID=A0AAV8Q0G6_ENSVE|nr:hypothetical protein OPV22_029179 [Ensete ventricosum]